MTRKENLLRREECWASLGDIFSERSFLDMAMNGEEEWDSLRHCWYKSDRQNDLVRLNKNLASLARFYPEE